MLEAFREELNITDKQEIAKKLGYKSEQSVYKVIKGKLEMGFTHLRNFQFYTKRSIDWLLIGDEFEDIEYENQPMFLETDEKNNLPKRKNLNRIDLNEILDERIRSIVREEITKLSPPEEKDAFDLGVELAPKSKTKILIEKEKSDQRKAG